MQVNHDIDDYDLLIITTDSKQERGFINMIDTLTTDSVVLKGYDFKTYNTVAAGVGFGGGVVSTDEAQYGMIVVRMPWLTISTLSPNGNSSALLLPWYNTSTSSTNLSMNMRIRLPTRTSIQKAFPISVNALSYTANGPVESTLYGDGLDWSLTLYFEVRHSHLFM